MLDFTAEDVTSQSARGLIQLLPLTAGAHACCSALLIPATIARLNFPLIWQLCSNHDKGLPVLLEDPVASPWSSKHRTLSVLCCITPNCLTLFWHGHSVELGLAGYHTPLFGEQGVCVCHFFVVAHFSDTRQDTGIIIFDPSEDVRHSFICSFYPPQFLILHSYLLGALLPP